MAALLDPMTGAAPRVADLSDLPPETPLAHVEFAVVDVESNFWVPESQSGKRGDIVSIGAVVARGDGTVVDRWYSLVRPPSGNPGPTEVHDITEEMLADAPSFGDVHEELLALMDRRPVVGHNLVFDARFIRAELRRIGYATRPGVVGLDTLDLARGAPRDFGANRLKSLCDHFNEPLDGWHSADADADATARLLPHLFGEHGLHDVGDLLGVYEKARGPLSWIEQAPVAA